jgi:DNA-binding XRE family transcriptional regulator
VPDHPCDENGTLSVQFARLAFTMAKLFGRRIEDVFQP